MKLESLKVSRYRSLRDVELTLEPLNVFIGPNASGKSTILDALRFLHEAVEAGNFYQPVRERGGIVHLAWKGQAAQQIELRPQFVVDGKRFEWRVRLVLPPKTSQAPGRFSVEEDVFELPGGQPRVHLLETRNGKGWWWSDEKREQVNLDQSATACALVSASPNVAFGARGTSEFVKRWGFFDPSPFSLRRDWSGWDPEKLDTHGRNLAGRLYALRESSPHTFEEIVDATRSILGLPDTIEPAEHKGAEEDGDGHYYFLQTEPGLNYRVHQRGVSSGTLRVLALMTALFGETDSSLVGMEEPENHVHPKALEAFAEYLLKAKDRVQMLVTTHSPLLLNYLDEPSAVCVVTRAEDGGTRVQRERNAEGVREALQESGFGLGEFYETTGFGGRAA